MTPKEKSRDMIEAIKYNLDNGLMTVDEVRSAKTPKEKIDLAMRALMNWGLHLMTKRRTDECGAFLREENSLQPI